MLLAIDIGNTNIVLGLFEGSHLTTSWRLATAPERTADELDVLMDLLFSRRRIEKATVRAVVVGSVVPPLTPIVQETAMRSFGMTALTVEPGANTGMPIRYDNPHEVGADRIVNAVAAYEQFGKPAHRPLIVVDVGTATKVDAVTAMGEYLGGAICPGLQMSADSLFLRTAKLPRVAAGKPAHAIGRTTMSAIESGVFYGHVGMIEGLIRRIGEELGGNALVVATGGLAGPIASETPLINSVAPDLTLQGLRIVWERNQP